MSMGDVQKYKVIETTSISMGETWWNVVDYDAKEPDERHVYGTFTKSRLHAEIFCCLMNISGKECRNLEKI